MSPSVAPKERINIVYKSVRENAVVERELPLKLLVIGELGNFQNKLSIQDRDVMRINKHNFNDVLKNMDVSVEADIFVNGVLHKQRIAIDHIDDFSPDKLVKKLEHVEKLLKMRNALLMLKGPIGNIPEFRKFLEAVLLNREMRDALRVQLSSGGEMELRKQN